MRYFRMLNCWRFNARTAIIGFAPLIAVIFAARAALCGTLQRTADAIARLNTHGSISRVMHFCPDDYLLAKALISLAGHPVANTIVVSVDLSDMDVTEQDLHDVKVLPSIQVLSLRNCSVADEISPVLSGLPLLQSLDIANTNVSDKIVKSLGGHRYLTDIHLSGTGVTPDGVCDLIKEHGLEKLEVGPRLTTDLCKACAESGSIECLAITGGTIGIDEIRELAKSRILMQIILTECKVSPGVISELGHIPTLRNLSLNRMAFDSRAIAP